MPTFRTDRTRLLSLITGILVAIGGAQTLLAQPDAPSEGGSGGGAEFVELADEPFHLDTVGLTVRLPVGVIAQSATEQNGVLLAPPLGKGKWTIQIDTRQTSNKEATITEAADQAIAALQTAYGTVDRDRTVVTQTYAELLDRSKGLIVNNSPAERFYMSLPANPGEGGDDKDREVRGFTFFKPTATTFVIFELRCPMSEYRKARHIYETTLATASFEDASAVAMARGAAIVAGARLFESLTPADYIEAMGVKPGQDEGPEIAYRLFKPASSGADQDAEELGYRFVKFWRGKRGELDPDKPRSQYSRAEQQEGFLARIRGRILTPVGTGDTEGIYFMTPDRAEEAWSVRTVVRGDDGRGQKDAVLASATETGARSGHTISVVVDEKGQPSKTIQPVLQERGKGYVSQVEAYLLPQILMLKKAPGDYGFYAYQSQSGTVSLRRDTLSQDAKAAGAWTIETVFREGAGGSPQKSVYTEDGRLVRTVLEDGRVWEPIDGETLLQLWKKKGLPTGK